jgi:penicillin amidase
VRTARSRLAAVATALSAAGLILPAGHAVAGPRLPLVQAATVVPPGQSGADNLANFAAATAGAAPTYGPHTQDQLPLYAGWRYKQAPLHFGPLAGVSPPGDPRVRIWRDHWDVPVISAPDERDLFYGVGYAMAEDRLFQMEVFRHVGEGTLAELIGAAGIPMDEAVRQVTDGRAALLAQFAALPANVRQRYLSFIDGVNAYIQQAERDPELLPSEFALLGDLPIAKWTPIDVLGFGEYAAKFFGEFDDGSLAAAKIYVDLVHRFGQRRAERIFDDVFRLNDPAAPTTIPAADGRFPRHTAAPVPTGFTGSPYANHDPALLPSATDLAPVAALMAARQTQIQRLQRVLALPRWGSNAILVSGRRTATGRPLLYGGPQTGWAVPGFFWEAELRDPVRHERGVMVPDIPLMVIGYNTTSAWTVTSAEDGNADTFVLHLDRTNTFYVHDGHRLAVDKQTETIPCRNPPTTAAALPAVAQSGSPPALCPVPPVQITVYRSVYGPAVAGPDAGHHLYVRESVVDGRLMQALTAWDAAGLQHSAAAFGRQVARMPLGFNFFYAGPGGRYGQIAYWHAGRYPIRPRNVDPNLPVPGTGAFDWRGFEPFASQPHVLNPPQGYLANWNNKPAVGWWSATLGDDGVFAWGDANQVTPLQAVVGAHQRVTFALMAHFPEDVAYIDNPARVFLPYLERALLDTRNRQLVTIRRYLVAWNRERDDVNRHGGYATPAVVFTDRFFEQLLAVVLTPELGSREFLRLAGLDDCGDPPCHYVSVDNLTAPTYKFEFAAAEVVLAAFRGQTRYDFLANVGGWRTALLRAAERAAAQLTAQQGADVARWNEPVEQAVFSAQGAIAVPPVTPLPNRGSYGQVVEAG